MEQPKRILVRTPNWLGDHVMALGAYQGLRQLFPNSILVCWHPAGLKGVVPEGLFDEDWEFSKADLRNSSKRQDWIQKIKEAKFDVSINFNASWSSALIFFRAKIPQRFGFSESGSRILLTRAQSFKGVNAGIHKSDIYFGLLSLFKKNIDRTLSVLNENRGSSSLERYWVIAPGAALPLREWPYFPELIFEIKKKYPNQSLKIVGTDIESVWKTRIARWKLNGVEELIGKTTVSELKEFCAKAELVIANDSGVAHLSATLAGARTLVLFGPGNPKYIAPKGPKMVPVRAEPAVSCSPCEKTSCRAPQGYQKCLKDISVEAVLSKIETALSL